VYNYTHTDRHARTDTQIQTQTAAAFLCHEIQADHPASLVVANVATFVILTVLFSHTDRTSVHTKAATVFRMKYSQTTPTTVHTCDDVFF